MSRKPSLEPLAEGPIYMSPREVQAWLRQVLGREVGLRHIQQAALLGRLPGLRVGSRWLFHPDDVRGWLERSGGKLRDPAASAGSSR
jgi:excisionase family DNA binding protein